MIYQSISSPQNALIKKIVKLGTSKSLRASEKLVILDGVHLCETFLHHTKSEFEHLFVSSDFIHHPEFKAFKDQKNIIEVPKEILLKISPTKSPIGIVGVIALPEKQASQKNKILALNGVQDPGNMGTMLRSAAAFGVDQIFLDPTCVDIWSPKVLRAGMGAHFYLDIQTGNLENFLQNFDGNIYGTMLDPEACRLRDTKFGPKWMLVMGNEGAGIEASIQKHLTQKIYIPMEAGTESLNVGVAAGICLYAIHQGV